MVLWISNSQIVVFLIPVPKMRHTGTICSTRQGTKTRHDPSVWEEYAAFHKYRILCREHEHPSGLGVLRPVLPSRGKCVWAGGRERERERESNTSEK